ncbi:hypothetical protein C8F04DRAFT_161974 [Mycena alexandri]|uniref:Uncharacterized protein n=1 Tax=Mycena alexandri TaxID=1745969 RepID=A0AAD6SBE4_9AGAR|nr:hypothetical protein C8F04DRAFT_161974 [Mycena alexandri]
MFAKSAIVSLALVAVASPVMSAPVPESFVEARELEARLSLPAGAISGLVKSLGKGLLSGAAVSGLLSLFGDSTSTSTAAPASSRRDLEARAGIASLLDGLIGAGEESLESVLKKAVLGGLASGAAAAGVNAAASQTNKRGIPAAVVEDGAAAAEKGIASILGEGAAGGIGSALGGLGIGAIISKLFGYNSSSSSTAPAASSKRALADLSDAEFNTLLEWINEKNSPSAVAARAVALGCVGKGVAGLVAGLAATQGAESVIGELEKIFKREPSLNELD